MPKLPPIEIDIEAQLTKVDNDLKKLKTTFGGLEKTVVKNTQAAQNFESQSSKHYRNAEKGSRKLIAAINNQTRAMASFHKKSNKALDDTDKKAKKATTTVDKLKSAFLKLGGAYVLQRIFTGIIGKAAEFEAEMISVQKTTELADDQIKQLGRDFIELSKVIPISANELAKVATVAGQLGIKGRDNILNFTETIAKASIALPEFSGGAEQIAIAIAKTTNAFELNIDQASNLLSSYNALSNSTAANAFQISAFNENFAGAAKTLGITADQAAAFGTTLISMGGDASDSATRASSAFTMMFENMDEVAKITGKSKEELRGLFDRDILGGLTTITDEIGKIGSNTERMQVATDIFGKIGAKVMLKLVGQTDQLNENLEFSAEQFALNTSLSEEFAVAAKSFNSQLQVFRNQFAAIAINVGQKIMPTLIAAMDDLTSSTNDSTSTVENLGGIFVVVFELIVDIIKGASTTLKLFIIAVATGFSQIKEIATTTWDAISSLSDTFVENTKASYQSLANAVQNAFISAFNIIASKGNTVLEFYNNVVKKVGGEGVDFRFELKTPKKATVKNKIKGFFGSFTKEFKGLGERLKINQQVGTALFGETAEDFVIDIDKSIDRVKESFAKGADITSDNVAASKAMNAIMEKNNETKKKGNELSKEEKKELDKQAKSVEKLWKTYEKGLESSDKKLADLDEKFADHIRDIEKQTRGVINDLLGLEKGYVEDLAQSRVESSTKLSELRNSLIDEEKDSEKKISDLRKDLADEEIESLQKVADLKEKLLDPETDPDKRKSLRRDIQDEQKDLQAFQADALEKIREEEANTRKFKAETDGLINLERKNLDDSERFLAESAEGKAAVAELERKSLLSTAELRNEKFLEEKAILDEKQEILNALKNNEILDINEIQDFKNKEFLIEENFKKDARINEKNEIIAQRQEIEQAFFTSIQDIETAELESIARRSEAYDELIEKIRQAYVSTVQTTSPRRSTLSEADRLALSRSSEATDRLPRFHDGGVIAASNRVHKNLANSEVPIVAQKGEFMVKRKVAQKNMPFLKNLNAGIPTDSLVKAQTINNNSTKTITPTRSIHQVVEKVENVFPHSGASASEVLRLMQDEENNLFRNLGL